jgi:hypothetical protein
MLIKEGIKLYSDLANITDQLFINEGTTTPREGTGSNYHAGSYIPRPGWRPVNTKEAGLLLTRNRNIDYRKSIYVGDIPGDLKESFLALGLYECTTFRDILPQFLKKENEVKSLSDQLQTYLRSFSSTNNFKFHKLTRGVPNRETVSGRFVKGQFIYIGLHIDQSRLFTPYTAHKSGNRISINLSRETRYLAFINLSLIQVMNMLREKVNLANTRVDAHNIDYLFFKHFPEYPVVKVGLKPYQYYVAPTDNFFHDASTLGNTEIDVTLVFTGVFDMPN